LKFLVDHDFSERLASCRDPSEACCPVPSCPIYDSPSSCPDMTDSPQSPNKTTDTAYSSPSFQRVHQLEDEDGIEHLPAESCRSVASQLKDSDIPFFALDALEEHEHDQTVKTALYDDQGTLKSPYHTISTICAPTWPVDHRSNYAKVREGSTFSRGQRPQLPQSHTQTFLAHKSFERVLFIEGEIACMSPAQQN